MMNPERVPAPPASSSMCGWIQGALSLFLWPLIPQARCHLMFTQRFQCGASSTKIITLIIIIDYPDDWLNGALVLRSLCWCCYQPYKIYNWLFYMALTLWSLSVSYTSCFLDLFSYSIQLHSGFCTLQFEDFLYGTNLFLCSKFLTI